MIIETWLKHDLPRGISRDHITNAYATAQERIEYETKVWKQKPLSCAKTHFGKYSCPAFKIKTAIVWK